jgi:hypothetical protein
MGKPGSEHLRVGVDQKPGDLVKSRAPWSNLGHGIVKRSFDRLAQNNKCYEILWHSGETGNNVWEYDLELLNEAR